MLKTSILLLPIIVLHGFLLKILVFFPYPEIFVYPYLAKNGFLPYKHILDQHFPSLLMMSFNFRDLGITTPESARIYLIGSVILSHILMYAISQFLFTSKKLQIIPNFIFLIFQPLFDGYMFWIDSLLVPIVLAAFYFLLRVFKLRDSGALFMAGLFLGIAVFFKQAMVPLIGIVFLYLIYKRITVKGLLVFCGAASFPILYMLIWVVGYGMVYEFWYWTVMFNFQVYAKMAQQFPTFNQLLRTGFVFGPAFLYIIAHRWHAKELSKEVKNDDTWILLSIFMLLGLFTVSGRFEFVHLQPSLPFAIFLSLLFFTWFSKYNLFAKGAFIAYGIVSLLWFGTFYKYHIGTKVYFFDEETRSVAEAVRNLTQSTDRILAIGVQPTVYTLSERLPAGGAFTVFVPWNLTVGETQILEGLKNDTPELIVRNSSSSIDGQNVVLFSPHINAFIDQNYKIVTMIGENEILMQKDKSDYENSN